MYIFFTVYMLLISSFATSVLNSSWSGSFAKVFG